MLMWRNRPREPLAPMAAFLRWAWPSGPPPLGPCVPQAPFRGNVWRSVTLEFDSDGTLLREVLVTLVPLLMILYGRYGPFFTGELFVYFVYAV